MKNLLLLFAFTLCLGFVNAQTTPTTTTTTTTTTKPVTTTTTTTKPAAKEQAKPATKPMDAAKPAAKPMDPKMGDMNTKEHVCTPACKDGKHVYAHGEKGHVCTDAEMKAMGKKTHKHKHKAKKAAPATTPAEKKN